ncbi:MAG: PH domain-containing protein [Oscillospiraceae bacterium]|nr:PH domain-containing protein [Oscillospiraceae bacterium]
MAKKDKQIDYVGSDRKRPFLGLPISFTKYYLTENRLITRAGLFNVDEDELELYRIVDKSLKRSFWQRMLGVGTLVLFCKDVDTPEKHIVSVKCPREVSDLIGSYITQYRDRYAIRGRDMIGSAGDGDCDHY